MVFETAEAMTHGDDEPVTPPPPRSENPQPEPICTKAEDAPGPTARTDPRLLEILVCPLTKTTLELSRDRSELISRRARLAYPIRDGIPLLTRETARELTDEDLRNL
jgi:hypothetical protein